MLRNLNSMNYHDPKHIEFVNGAEQVAVRTALGLSILGDCLGFGEYSLSRPHAREGRVYALVNLNSRSKSDQWSHEFLEQTFTRSSRKQNVGLLVQ